MQLADIAGELKAAEIDLQLAIEQVEKIEQSLIYLELQHAAYIEWMDQHRDDYQNKCDEFAEAYNNASQATKDAFKKEIIERFDRFKEAFEESNQQYISMMNDLTADLYTKVATVQQHSMVQRSMIMNLHQDYCDGLFYFSFDDCYAYDDVPTMSDDFMKLLEKLKSIEWNSINSLQSLGNHLPQAMGPVYFTMVDEHLPYFNSSQMYGPATSLRETGEIIVNFKDHESWLDHFYRIRINSVKVH